MKSNPPLTEHELVTRAVELAPLLAEHAAEAEQLRRPVDAVIDALRESGVFRLMVPRKYGGLEFDLDTFLEVGLALAEGDASMSWVTTFYIEHNWMLCQFPDSFQEELFSQRAYVLARALQRFRGAVVGAPPMPELEALGVVQADDLDAACRELGLTAAPTRLEDVFHRLPRYRGADA